MKKPKIIFFGTPEFSVKILETLKNNDYSPALIITSPDKPRGRKLQMTPSPVKIWGQKNKIKFLQPDKLNDSNVKRQISDTLPDLFIVASYGKILPKHILEIPEYGTLNVHPSFLPELRGPSPIQTAILEGKKETGVTIMLMDEKMDTGPILAQQKLEYTINNIQYPALENKLAELGGKLLIETIPKWLSGEIKPTSQDESKATYSKLIKKQDGLIDLNESPEIIERKIRAFTPWPGIYYFSNNKRIIITKATLNNKGRLEIKKVKPEGKKEMDYKIFSRN